MKRILSLSLLSLCIFFLAGFGRVPNTTTPQLDSIKTYKDIPEITAEEITAIEALKSARGKFSYGAMLATEAYPVPDGSIAGFSAEFCKLLSELFGIRFELEVLTWDDMWQGINSQSLDFTGEFTPTEERKQAYSMSHPIAERLLRIFIRKDLEISNEAAVHGRKLGFFAGSATSTAIGNAYPLSFESIHIDSYEMAAEMIRTGQIDAFVCESVADPAFTKYDFIRSALFFPLVHQPVSMTTANPELAPVISVLNKYLSAGGINKLYDLHKEGEFNYAKHKLHASFTSEEKAFLDDLKQRGESVKFGLSRDNYPVNFYNEKEKEFQGIALDVLAEISRLTDIEFAVESKANSVWPEILEALETGTVPMIVELLHTEERKEHFNWSAVPYARSYYVIMSRGNYPILAPYQVPRVSVGVLKKSGFYDVYHRFFSEKRNLREYNTLGECLTALEHGDVDLLMASENMLLTQTNYHEKPGFKINVKLNTSMDSSFGFHKDQNVLRSIMDKAQQYVATDQIETSWKGRGFDYSKKLAEERAFFLTYFVSILMVLLVVSLVLLVKNLHLSKKLKAMADSDALTGILNRRRIMELALMKVARSVRLGTNCFVVIFDLDYFKVINDTYGHLAGDNVLKETAHRVNKTIRPYDLFGRYGGEEFILFVPDINLENMQYFTERLRQDLCKTPVEFEGKEIQISASFGVARVLSPSDIEAAIQRSDQAMYQAKKEGRNKVVFSEEGME